MEPEHAMALLQPAFAQLPHCIMVSLGRQGEMEGARDLPHVIARSRGWAAPPDALIY